MDPASAEAIRNYVHGGGTVVMTALSAKVDETSQWFDTPLPGRLADVFGIRTSEFYRPQTLPQITLNGKTETASLRFYEVVEPLTAQPMAEFANTPERSPAITVNRYGKGQAIYVAVPAQMEVLAPLVRALYPALGIEKGPETPPGVYARVIEGRTLYVNTTGEDKDVPIRGRRRGVLSGTAYEGLVRLRAYAADLVE